jgi:hypothetical protein
MPGAAFPLQRQQKRTLEWPSNPYGNVLGELLCALRQRYLAVGLTPPILSIAAYPAADRDHYNDLLTALAIEASPADRNGLAQQVHTAIRALAGYYVTPAVTVIDLTAITVMGVLAIGATWESFPVACAALRALQYLAEALLTISGESFNYDGCAALSGLTYASWLIPRSISGKAVYGYALGNASTLTGNPLSLTPFLGDQQPILALTSLLDATTCTSSDPETVSATVTGAVGQAFTCLPGPSAPAITQEIAVRPLLYAPGQVVTADLAMPGSTSATLSILVGNTQTVAEQQTVSLTNGSATAPVTLPSDPNAPLYVAMAQGNGTPTPPPASQPLAHCLTTTTNMCPTSGAVTVVLSGIVSCGCQGQYTFSFSGLNGAISLTWNGSDFSAPSNVGSYTITSYQDPGCSGTPTIIQSGVFGVGASCAIVDGMAIWSPIVSLDFADPFGNAVVFAVNSGAPLGTSMTNVVACPPTNPLTSLYGGGNATVSIP